MMSNCGVNRVLLMCKQLTNRNNHSIFKMSP